MATPPDHLPRRHLSARQPSAVESHVQYRHELGRDQQGSRHDNNLCQRMEETVQEVQRDIYLLCTGHFDHDRFRSACASLLANHRDQCHDPLGRAGGHALFDAGGVESGFDDVEVVIVILMSSFLLFILKDLFFVREIFLTLPSSFFYFLFSYPPPLLRPVVSTTHSISPGLSV